MKRVRLATNHTPHRRSSDDEPMNHRYFRAALWAAMRFILCANMPSALVWSNPFLGEVETFAFGFCWAGRHAMANYCRSVRTQPYFRCWEPPHRQLRLWSKCFACRPRRGPIEQSVTAKRARAFMGHSSIQVTFDSYGTCSHRRTAIGWQCLCYNPGSSAREDRFRPARLLPRGADTRGPISVGSCLWPVRLPDLAPLTRSRVKQQ
jgi:hypothetical protein